MQNLCVYSNSNKSMIQYHFDNNNFDKYNNGSFKIEHIK